MYGIPYFADVTLLHDAIQKTSGQASELSGVNILLVHQTPSFISNTSIPADFDPHSELFDPFDIVFCGHIHTHEVIGKVVVVGSPLQNDQGDKGDKKGFLVYDTETKKLERIFTNYPEFYTKPAGEPDPDDFNYYVEVPTLLSEVTQDQEFYASTVIPEDIIRKYWQDSDGKDSERLGVGLDIIRRL